HLDRHGCREGRGGGVGVCGQHAESATHLIDDRAQTRRAVAPGDRGGEVGRDGGKIAVGEVGDGGGEVDPDSAVDLGDAGGGQRLGRDVVDAARGEGAAG